MSHDAEGRAGRTDADSDAQLDDQRAIGVEVHETIVHHDETDGRRRYEWSSRYPRAAKWQIRLESLFVAAILAASLIGIYVTWSGPLVDLMLCNGCSPITLKRYAYFFFSGMLGATLFGGKFLYHVVARGYWHQDRLLWRILSPFLSASLAFVIAAVVDSGMLGLTFRPGSSASCIALGFLSGYFADKALAKMQEIADVIFGTHETGRDSLKHKHGKEQPQKRD